MLGSLEALETALAHGIGHDDRNAPSRSVGQMSRAFEDDWSPDYARCKKCVGPLEVFEGDRPLADADRLGQPHARRLVTHVGTVGEVVGTKGTRNRLVEEGSLIGRPARAVELGFVSAIQRSQYRARAAESFVPADRHEPVRDRIVPHRLGEPAGVFERVIAPLPELGDRVREERSVGAFDGRLPRHGLRTVLTEFEG